MKRTLLNAGFFRVDELTVRDRSGAERQRRIVVHPGAAVVLARLEHRRIILLRQVREAAGGELLELPAGKVDPQEDPETCARRELEEETGYRPGRIEKLCEFFTSPGILTEKMHAFVAEDLTEVGRQPQADEELTLITMTFDQALDLVRRRRITDGKTLITLMMFELLGRRC